MGIRRGEIWWASLIPPSGSEPGYRRPVLIVQSNKFNESRIGTIIAVAITSNRKLALAPGNVLLKSSQTGLSKDSVANVSQIVTVNKSFLTDRIGRIKSASLKKVESGMRLVLFL